MQYEISKPEPTMQENTTVVCKGQVTLAHAWHEGFAHYATAAVLNQQTFGRDGEACPFNMETGFITELVGSTTDPGYSCSGSCALDPVPDHAASTQATYLSLWDLRDGNTEGHDRVNGNNYYAGTYGTYMPTGGYVEDWIFKLFDGPLDWYSTDASPADILKLRTYWTPYGGSVEDMNLILAGNGVLPPACTGSCGSYQSQMACWCDADCTLYGDCCSDGSACSVCGSC